MLSLRPVLRSRPLASVPCESPCDFGRLVPLHCVYDPGCVSGTFPFYCFHPVLPTPTLRSPRRRPQISCHDEFNSVVTLMSTARTARRNPTKNATENRSPTSQTLSDRPNRCRTSPTAVGQATQQSAETCAVPHHSVYSFIHPYYTLFTTVLKLAVRQM